MTQRPFPRELAAHVTTRTASKAALLRNYAAIAIPKPRQRSTKDAADEKHFPVLSDHLKASAPERRTICDPRATAARHTQITVPSFRTSKGLPDHQPQAWRPHSKGTFCSPADTQC